MLSFIIAIGKLLQTVLSIPEVMIIISRKMIAPIAFEWAIGKIFLAGIGVLPEKPGFQDKMFTHLIQR